MIKANRYIREQEIAYLTDAKAKLNEANNDLKQKYKQVPKQVRNRQIQNIFINTRTNIAGRNMFAKL